MPALGQCPAPYPSARCDLNTVTLPTVPPKVGANICVAGSLNLCGNLNGKGTTVIDPNFGSTISRLSDATFNPAHPNFTIITTGSTSGDENLFNCNDTMLQMDDIGGRTYPNNFSGTTATRMYATDPAYSANGGFFIANGTEFWGRKCPADANIQYYLGNGLLGAAGNVGPKLGHLDFTNQATVPSFVLDFDFTSSPQCLGVGFTVTWTANGGNDQFDTDFGFGFSNNGSQGGTGAIYVAVWRRGSGCRVLNLSTLTVTGDWGPTGAITGTTCNTGKIHNVKLFKGGGAGGAILVEAQPGQCADANGMPYTWQYNGLTYAPQCPSQCSGHWTEGLTTWVNNTGNAAPNFYDRRTITNTSPIGIVPALPAGGTQPQMDEHEGWNALNDNYPLFATTALFTGASITKAWANEVIAIDPLGLSNPWRFVNTYITGLSQRFSTQYAIGSISQTGKYFMFSSDWLNTLGSESGAATCTPTVDCRGDVFVVQLNAHPLNFFGIHYNNTLSLYPPNPTISFQTVRLWDTKTGWADMQVGPNCTHTVTTDCRFSRLDTWINKFNSPRAKIILTLAKTPNFIASNTSDTNCGYTNSLGTPNGSCTPPTDVNCDGTGTDATWINFITALWDHINASGFQGRINYLEIWNEWNVPTFYDITYINSTKCPGVTNAAHKILTRLEQDARCVLKIAGTTTCNAGGTYPMKGEEHAVQILSPPLPGPGNSNNQIKTNGAEDKLLSVGGGNYADYISIHAYMNSKGNTVPANCGAAPANAGCMWPENLVSLITQLNTLQNSYSLNLPMIISEGSWGAQSNTTDAQFEQAYVARYITLMLQYGVQVFPWYNVDGGNVSLPVLYANNATGILTTGGAAYQTIESWLAFKNFSQAACTVTAQPSCSGGASSNTYVCPLTTGEQVVWYDEVADNASCSFSSVGGFSSYLTMNNTVVPISGPITLDNRPILMEPAPLSPTNLIITPGVTLTPGTIITKEPYEKDTLIDFTGLAGNL